MTNVCPHNSVVRAAERSSTGDDTVGSAACVIHETHPFDRFLVCGFEPAKDLLANVVCCGKDWHLSGPGTFGREVSSRRGRFGMVDLDGLAHRRLRRPAVRALSAVSHLVSPSVLRAIASRLVGNVFAKDRFDVVGELAKPFAGEVIAELMGIPASEKRHFLMLSLDWMHLCDPAASAEEIQAGQRAHYGLLRLFQHLVELRSVKPRTDFVSEMVRASGDGEGDDLSEEEVATICLQVMLAGGVTVVDAIGNGVVALLSSPQELAKLQREPDLIPAAVQEILRYSPPVGEVHRFTSAPLMVADTQIEAGRTVSISVLSCNHDPERFAGANTFDVTRPDTAHLTYGGGPHRCLGYRLADQELAAIFSALVQFAHRFELVSSSHKMSSVFNGYREVVLQRSRKASD